MRVLDLIERQATTLARDGLSADEAAVLVADARARVAVEWPSPANSFRWVVTPRGWIGSLPVSPALAVRIRPKMRIGHLFSLLDWSGGGQGWRLFPGLIPVAGVEEALEHAVALLVRKVRHRVEIGLAKDYCPRVSTGQQPRGRIAVRESALAFAKGRISFTFAERPLTPDIDDNGIIAWTLQQTARTDVAAPGLLEEVRALDRLLGNWTTRRAYTSGDCRNRSYTERTADYAELHALCAMVLEAIGPDPAPGDIPFSSFGVDMPRVFEKAVVRALGGLPGLTAEPAVQHRLGGGTTLRFVADCLLRDEAGAPAAVVDAKYKEATLPDQDDVQQVVAYATAFGVDKAFLVFPAPSGMKGVLKAGSVQLRAACFNLALPPNEAAELLCAEVAESLRAD